MQVGAVPLKELVRGQREKNIEVARWATADAGFPLTGQPDAGAVFDALRDIDRQGPFALDASGSRTVRARIFDHLAAALTAGTGSLQRKETLRLPPPPCA